MHELLDDIVYAVFLHWHERVDNEKGKADFIEFKKEAMKEHNGDCTWEAQPCSRCAYEDYFDQAKIILKILYERHDLGR